MSKKGLQWLILIYKHFSHSFKNQPLVSKQHRHDRAQATVFIKVLETLKASGRSLGSLVYEKFYKLLQQSKASKQEVHVKFYKLVKKSKVKKASKYEKF